MEKKIGRPLLDETPKDALYSARVGVELAKPANSQAKGANQTKSQWLRSAIEDRVKGPPIWVKSKWKSEELDGEFIRFMLRKPGRELGGVGKLYVRKNGIGEIAVDIFVDEYPTPYKGIQTRIWLNQAAVDKIAFNTGGDSQKIKFILAG